jgi:hypothetical protein
MIPFLDALIMILLTNATASESYARAYLPVHLHSQVYSLLLYWWQQRRTHTPAARFGLISFDLFSWRRNKIQICRGTLMHVLSKLIGYGGPSYQLSGLIGVGWCREPPVTYSGQVCSTTQLTVHEDVSPKKKRLFMKIFIFVYSPVRSD